jgi:hypothetical protein
LFKVSSKIKGYKENINKGNFLIINLKPFYNTALRVDLTPFEGLAQIQQELERRNNKSVIIVADCADNLFQNQYFDQSELVESWWHRVELKQFIYRRKKQQKVLPENLWDVLAQRMSRPLVKVSFPMLR